MTDYDKVRLRFDPELAGSQHCNLSSAAGPQGGTIQQVFFGSESDQEIVAAMTTEQRVQRAITLFRDNEPPDGYYGAFSGGKD